jgi:hypothetical protein
MNITRATVLTGFGADQVYLWTDLPSALTAYSESLSLSFKATAGTGQTYVRNHFNINPIIIDRSSKRQPFKEE